jgi:NADPH:quinone reductase
MRTVAIEEFGGPEVLHVAELPVPEPGPGQVRIKVAAATVNPTDLGMRNGNNRALLEAFDKPHVPGMELAGTVDLAGEGVSFEPGERVLAIVVPNRTGRGAQSEFVLVPAASVVRVPDEITLEAAATLPMNGLTVQRALDLLDLAPGSTLLVSGAAGAVGGYGVELGVAAGLTVIAIAGADDEALVRGFGAAHFVERGDGFIERVRAIVPDGVDAALDAANIGPALFPTIRDVGGYATVRGFSGETERDITLAPVRVSEYAENTAALQRLIDLVAAGQLTLRVAETFPPERVREAHERLAAGGVRGRLVITF